MFGMKKAYIVFAILGGLFLLTSLMLQLTGTISLSVNGFGVDHDGLLYLGQDNVIVVFKNGTKLRTIEPPTSRGYQFTLTDGETIVLSTGTLVYEMDLYGKILSEKEDENAGVYSQLQWKRTFRAQDGSEYRLTYPFGRAQIEKDGNILYQMPLFDYIIGFVTVIMFIVAFTAGILFAVKKIKTLLRKPQTNG